MPPCDPQCVGAADARALHKAIYGAGTDDATLISILASHDNSQLMDIRAAYEAGFALVDDIKGDTYGSYERLLVGLVTERDILEAQYIREAVQGAGTDEDILIDIIMSRTPEELRAISDMYQTQYSRDMAEDVLGEFKFKGKLKKVFAAALAMNRETGPTVDADRVQQDIEELHKATKGLGTDESAVFEVLFSRSVPHLREVFAGYEEAYGKTVRDVMKSEFKAKVEDAVVACVDWVTDPSLSAAVMIHRAIKGLGTNEKRLECALATRYDLDGGNIALAYDTKYGPGQCVKDIKGDLTGTIEKLCLALLKLE
ncbi:annexin [Kipferlia bialata]|uniref:Annexin n=1 Tax=Kipferlia bialata TaxID=797122 RepID=A0A9K3GKF4_9EUKA|nr:annexin [Kipferlia bialata]|eukprot:g7260.t1